LRHRAADIGREQGKESDYVPEDGQTAAVVHQVAAKWKIQKVVKLLILAKPTTYQKALEIVPLEMER
jgi:hypothetical protein